MGAGRAGAALRVVRWVGAWRRRFDIARGMVGSRPASSEVAVRALAAGAGWSLPFGSRLGAADVGVARVGGVSSDRKPRRLTRRDRFRRRGDGGLRAVGVGPSGAGAIGGPRLACAVPVGCGARRLWRVTACAGRDALVFPFRAVMAGSLAARGVACASGRCGLSAAVSTQNRQNVRRNPSANALYI